METAQHFWELFNWLDVVLSVGLVASFLVGLGAGFYRQVAIIASLGVGLLLASQLTQPVATAGFWSGVESRLGPEGAQAAAYGVVVLASLGVGLLSILIFRSFFGRTLRFVDSILGGVTGTTIGAFVFGLIFLGVFHWDNTWLHEPIRESYLGSRLAEGARVASQTFPEEFRQQVEAALHEVPALIDSDGTTESATPAPASFQEETPPPKPRPAADDGKR